MLRVITLGNSVFVQGVFVKDLSSGDIVTRNKVNPMKISLYHKQQPPLESLSL